MSLPPGFLDELRTRTSIAHVVGRKVMWDTKRSNQGKGDMWAPCPFHHEKTASFHVDDQKGFYHCFGCGAKGDAIRFVTETENVGFMEAVEILAREAGMEMPARDPQARQKADRNTQLAAAMEAAARWYRLQLSRAPGAEARRYLAGRGLSDAALERFEIGLAPPGWEGLREALAAKDIPVDQMLEAGLLRASDKGRAPYDVFRNRIMFPIRDGRGRVIAFGGRALDPDDRAKYLNSPETPLFDKSRTLYNLQAARVAAGKGQTLILAEGYMDVIALSEAGFEASVAPLGTAVTAAQLAMAWRIADEPVIALDGDAAGLRAAEKAMDVALPLLSAGKSLRFAILPQGKDPDDLIRAEGPAAVQAVLDAARPMIDLLWTRATEGRQFDSPERRAALDKSLRTAVARIEDPAVRHHYGQEIKDRLWALFRAPRPGKVRQAGRFPRRAAPVGPVAGTKRSLLASDAQAELAVGEMVVLAVILKTPALAAEFEARLDALTITDPVRARLRDAIVQAIGDEVAMEQHAAAAIGQEALESLLSARHVQIVPCMRQPGDVALARFTVNEALGRLEARHGWQAELKEAEADTDAWQDEITTWRLGQAARLQHGPLRRDDGSDADYDTAPNGAQISKTEREALDSLLSQIRFDRKPR